MGRLRQPQEAQDDCPEDDSAGREIRTGEDRRGLVPLLVVASRPVVLGVVADVQAVVPYVNDNGSDLKRILRGPDHSIEGPAQVFTTLSVEVGEAVVDEVGETPEVSGSLVTLPGLGLSQAELGLVDISHLIYKGSDGFCVDYVHR